MPRGKQLKKSGGSEKDDIESRGETQDEEGLYWVQSGPLRGEMEEYAHRDHKNTEEEGKRHTSVQLQQSEARRRVEGRRVRFHGLYLR